MIIKNVELETVCGVTSKIPTKTMPELGFAVKSNVGKSSLINGLMNRKSYARVSQQPGKTQTINYYLINRDHYYVDLPGYGYAKVSKDMQDKWKKLIERYLNNSGMLQAVFLLIDIRREPSANDLMMAEWIRHNGYELIIIATKLDKIKRSQVQKQLKGIKEGLKLRSGERIIPWSASTKQGREEIYQYIDEKLETFYGAPETSSEEEVQ